ncbi:TatD family hydrolase [Maribellus sp. YY47]|uniref:TatD family hydrolase n=1 Tax=Maribellus sp. YY47 TaxID=2929486 RepID=UPI002000AB63|nr:TatD family hydrolase [Maribellus sp. YY47]MCK3684862.1 TatD family hydrolase [Maribellus sp. YY47]
MNPVPFVDIHTHPSHYETDTITVQNIYPGDGFAAFTGRNFYSVGLHPWHIGTEDENNEALQLVEEALEFDHVIFVGEAGLDKVCEKDFAEQSRVFEAQAFIAEEYQYPLIIHCVKAYNEVIALRKKMKPSMTWIMHGYNGSIEITKQMAEMDFMFSFGDILFRDNVKAIESFRYLPLNRVFLETDEMDGEVEQIYQRAALLKQIPVEELKKAVWKNFNRIEKTLSGRY